MVRELILSSAVNHIYLMIMQSHCDCAIHFIQWFRGGHCVIRISNLTINLSHMIPVNKVSEVVHYCLYFQVPPQSTLAVLHEHTNC